MHWFVGTCNVSCTYRSSIYYSSKAYILYHKYPDWLLLVLCWRKLEDSEAAEQYCAEIGRDDAYIQYVLISLLYFFVDLILSVCIFHLVWSYESIVGPYSMVHVVSIFNLRLLGLYLDPQNGKEPMFTAAVRLLHNHGKSLDPLQVLEVLLLHKYCQIH